MEEPFPQMNPIEEPVQDCLESLLPNIDFDNNCSSKGSMSLNDSVMIGNIGNYPHFRATQEMEIDSMLMDFFDNPNDSVVVTRANELDNSVKKNREEEYSQWTQFVDHKGEPFALADFVYANLCDEPPANPVPFRAARRARGRGGRACTPGRSSGWAAARR